MYMSGKSLRWVEAKDVSEPSFHQRFSMPMSAFRGDPVRPSDEAFESTFAHGYRTWSHLQHLAREKGHSQVILSGLRTVDHAFPHYPGMPSDLVLTYPVQGYAWAKATLLWDMIQSDRETRPWREDMRFQLAFPSPVVVEHSSSYDESWETKQLVMLFSAWAYVLAARWAELLPGMAHLRYADAEGSETSPREAPNPRHASEMTGVDKDGRDWWRYVQTPGSGWEAKAYVEGQVDMYSPWSLTVQDGQKHGRSGAAVTSPSLRDSPTYRQALGYVQAYSHNHRVHDISRAALAAAMFIPVARHDRRNIRLHELSFETKSTPDYNTAAFIPSDAVIDRLLMLSCNALGIKSLLHSTFYNPDVHCNFSGPWTQGLMRCLGGCDPMSRLSTLIHRDPDIGFLWAGAHITGFESSCLAQVSRGLWKVDLGLGALTGTQLSFMQANAAIDTGASTLSRADECRIKHLYQQSLGAANFAFAPFGASHVSDLDLDIRSHLLGDLPPVMQLRHVTWETTSGTKTVGLRLPRLREKRNLAPESKSGVPSPSDEERRAAELCSRRTTQAAFSWLREAPIVDGTTSASGLSAIVEGGLVWSLGERGIFEHEWLRMDPPSDRGCGR